MKVGIVVPFSWSFWGAVVEHAELQAQALRELGIETRTIIGNDPPGSFTRALHPRLGRHGEPPADVIPVGRSVIVPANGSLPNIVLSPRTVAAHPPRARAGALRRPPPARADDAGDLRRRARVRALPVVATFHAAGDLGWMRSALPLWGFLIDRIDYRIAVSRAGARVGRALAPRRVRDRSRTACSIPPEADPGGREHTRRLHRPARAAEGDAGAARGPGRRSTGAPARGCGSSAPTRSRCGCCSARARRVATTAIDVLGFVTQDELTRELLRAKVLAAPSLGGESFGMVLTRAFACATPVVASDIPGYRGVMTPRNRRARAARRPRGAGRGRRRRCSRTSRGARRWARAARGLAHRALLVGRRSRGGWRRSTSRGRRA